MESTALSCRAAASRLREKRQEQLTRGELGSFQKRVVAALSNLACELLHGTTAISFEVQQADETWEATWLSVEALLESWTKERLWGLIDLEEMRLPSEHQTPAVVGHFIASNTPHLLWTSAARALLVGAASIVRMPPGSEKVIAWSKEFARHLSAADRWLGELVWLTTFDRHDVTATRTICEQSDSILAYGSDGTVDAIRQLTPERRRFVGYGHRVSFGIIMEGADLTEAASGAALDIAVLDQQGCLSPQTIFVEGAYERACSFGASLACALTEQSRYFPARSSAVAAAIMEERMLARFKRSAKVFSSSRMAWTVIVSPSSEPHRASIPGLVYVEPFVGNIVSDTFSEMRGRLQGVSLVAGTTSVHSHVTAELQSVGVSYICAPGRLQRPPFEWREDGLDVLNSLV